MSQENRATPPAKGPVAPTLWALNGGGSSYCLLEGVAVQGGVAGTLLCCSGPLRYQHAYDTLGLSVVHGASKAQSVFNLGHVLAYHSKPPVAIMAPNLSRLVSKFWKLVPEDFSD